MFESSPYITTELCASISLDPSQMNNKIYKNLKSNVITRFEGKCMKDYGYIVKVYEINKYSDGYIVAENPKSAARFYVKFTCKLCLPLLNKQIICKIDKANTLILRLVNGPINVIITTKDRINKNVFFVDNKGILMAKKDNKSIPVEIGTYVKVTIVTRQFNDQDKIIMAIGILEDLATDKEIKLSYESEFGQDNVLNYDEYIKQEQIEDVDNIVSESESSVSSESELDDDVSEETEESSDDSVDETTE
jgi:DNA-directed RNA polymerase subunit E'/Rpb7